jgi:hypothetical protein
MGERPGEWEKPWENGSAASGTRAAKRRRVLVLCTVVLAAAAVEPSLEQAQRAAERRAAGEAASDSARGERLRRAHWAPVVRAELIDRADERSRRGEFRLAPVVEDDHGAALTWGVTVTWDLAQLIYAHEESQLALAHQHLARVRREAAERAAALWIERRRKREALPAVAGSAARREALFDLLRTTAELDALTGLYAHPLAEEQARIEAEKP